MARGKKAHEKLRKNGPGSVEPHRKRRVSGASKKPIEQYDHKDKQRVNNPPVGLVSEKTDKDAGKKTYRYDPHLDPELQFDHQRSQIERIIDDGMAAHIEVE